MVKLDDITVSQASIKLDTGMITTQHVEGELALKVDAGEIRIEQAATEHPINAATDTGNIDISFAETPVNATFELMVDIGKVELDIDDVTYEKNYHSIIKAKRGNDGPLIKATAEAGEISVK